MKIASSRVTADSLPDGIPLSLSVSLSLSLSLLSVGQRLTWRLWNTRRYRPSQTAHDYLFTETHLNIHKQVWASTETKRLD